MIFSSSQLFFGAGAVLALLIAFLFIAMPFISEKTRKKSKYIRVTIALIILAVSLISMLMYKRYGALEGLEDKLYMEKITQTLADIQASQHLSQDLVLNQLLALEHQLPKRSPLWSHLAGVYQHIGFTQHAAAAYKKAALWSPDIANYAIQQAYFLSSLQGGILESNLKTRLILFLTKEPLNQDILNLLAIDAYQHQNYNIAIQYWHTILYKSKDVSLEDRQAISVMLALAKHHVQKS